MIVPHPSCSQVDEHIIFNTTVERLARDGNTNEWVATTKSSSGAWRLFLAGAILMALMALVANALTFCACTNEVRLRCPTDRPGDVLFGRCD